MSETCSSTARDALRAATERAAARFQAIAAGTAPAPRGGLIRLAPAPLWPLLRSYLERFAEIETLHDQEIAQRHPDLVDEDGTPTLTRYAPVALAVLADLIPEALADPAGRQALLALVHAFGKAHDLSSFVREQRRAVRHLRYVPVHPPRPEEAREDREGSSLEETLDALLEMAERGFFDLSPVPGAGGGSRWPLETPFCYRPPSSSPRTRPRPLPPRALWGLRSVWENPDPAGVRRRAAAQRRAVAFRQALMQLLARDGVPARLNPIVITRPPYGCRPCRLRRRAGFLYRAGPPLVVAIPPDWRLRYEAVAARIVDEAGVLPLRLGRAVALEGCSGATGHTATLWRGLFLVRRALALVTTTGCLVEGQAGGRRRFAFGATVGTACEALARAAARTAYPAS